MAHRFTNLVRATTAMLVVATGMLLLAPSAAARVSIVPDQAIGGDTETFAFRLANERLDTPSTRLELIFPQDIPIAYAKVDPAPGWKVTINPRPLNPPAKMGDKVVNQVVGSMVFEGGSVAPHQFDQFMVTLGPLPKDGRLVFESIQTFANGAVERLATPPAPGQTSPAAPVITIGDTAAAAAAAPAPAASGDQNDDAGTALAVPGQTNTTAPAESGGAPLGLLWVALALAVLVIAIVTIRAVLLRRRAPEPPVEGEHAEEADPAEVHLS